MAWETLAPIVIRRLSSDLNLTPQQAAGVVGQLGHESAGLQAINEENPAVPGSRGGFGWAQWTGPRRQAFEQWAAENKADVSDPEANYQFLLHELKDTPEGRVLPALRAAPDAQAAGRLFTDQFLRPGVPAYDSRASWTQKALDFIMPAAQAGTLPLEQKMSMAERIQKARDAGFNDEEILARIQGNADMAARIQKAREAGFTDEEIYGRMGLQAKPQQPAQATQEQDQPGIVDRLGRQVGLTARYGLEGLGQVADIFTEPLRRMVVNPAARAMGLPEATESTGQMAARGADALGLPQPQGAVENVVGDTARLMAGAGGLSGGAGALSKITSGATQAGLLGLAMNPAQQVVSAGGAGAAGGAAREAGAPAPVQMMAGLAGGLAAPMAASAGQRIVQGVGNRIAAMRPSQVLDRVKSSLAQSGIAWETVPPRVQQQLMAEAAAALRTGDLNPQALARLADFQQVQGATPTRGMLTQDPHIVTREQNLAKMQAQLGGAGLPDIQNQNNAALVRALNEFNPNSDPAAVGASATGALQSRLNTQRSNINALYSQARDSAGRSFPLDGAAFTQRAGQLLDDNLVAGALPADVRNHLNQIAQGRVPFTVDYAEQLKTRMSALQRGTSDGSARYALGLVRQALDDTPILGLGEQTGAVGARAVNPGMLPAEPGNSALGEQAVGAFNRARGATRAMKRQIENTPALQALEAGDLAPEKFVQQYIASQSASNADVRRLGRLLAENQPARESVRSGIAQHLKDRALSGKPDDIGAARFSADQYAKALKALGDGKLGAFFDPAEIRQLHAIGRVGRLMVNQPVGSAVNNSNTAAAAIGRVLDMMGSAGRGFKLLGISDQIKAIEAALGQRKALGVRGALIQPRAPRQGAAIPAAIYGSALAAVPPSQDNRRQ
ncbi:phage tail tip lysozyme [Castellaniella denitrificans]|uniref:Phage tail tip lysozyme n=1 Tax=Castellaniella denitrificans TaxID=56119 RepID=A0ABT4M656_9BURK|nr:phage tail tip lysozyme [Castellaniella denitrificans]MCZ4330781.1 phage tail tip lysozyme [Castellaniella denitrificans]